MASNRPVAADSSVGSLVAAALSSKDRMASNRLVTAAFLVGS